MELFNSCRVCRQICDSSSILINSQIGEVELIEILTKTNPLIDFRAHNSIFPPNVCYSCFEIFNNAYELQKVALESDRYFREVADKSKIVIKRENSVEFEIFRDDPESADEEDKRHSCCFCDESFNSKISLKRHLKKHDPKKLPYGCKKCVERFVDLNGLMRHKHESKMIIYECDRCGFTSTKKKGIESHLKSAHAVKSSKFHEKLKIKKDFHIHELMQHKKLFRELKPTEMKINLKCCKCEKDHKSFNQLMRHISAHKLKFEVFKCLFCKQLLKTFSSFKEHSKYHTIPPTHKCLNQKCKKDFQLDEKFLNHIRMHLKYEQYKVECSECGLKLKSKKDFETHFRVRHKKEICFICPVCAKVLASNNALDQHIKFIHNAEESKKFPCKVCPMKFVSKNKLTRHECVHSTERPHKCEVCSLTFKHVDGLRMHMKRHNNSLSKNHKCSQCSLGFNTKNRLDQHMLTHTGIKPHECKFCDRAYASKGDLTKHMQKLHLGNSIYQCQKCPQGFRLIVELREHLSSHN